jgi:hypothetical protein
MQTLTLLAHLSNGPHLHADDTAGYLIAALALVTLCLAWRQTRRSA